MLLQRDMLETNPFHGAPRGNDGCHSAARSPFPEIEDSVERIHALDWAELLPSDQREIYSRVIRIASERNIPFALGGAVARTVFTEQWRNTKDLDVYVRPEDRDRMVAVLEAAGLLDHHDVLAYDRSWIYRGSRDGVIVDVIWTMANYRADVDATWIDGGPRVPFLGELVSIVPVEELIWAKLYVVQRARCDWPDILNLVDAQASSIDWKRLVARLGPDLPLLRAVLVLYGWLCPEKLSRLPRWIRDDLRLVRGGPDDLRASDERIALIDSRPWFGADITIGPLQ